jgi:hypothetical protein
MMATIEDVRRIALSLPETSERPLYGTAGFRVKDKAFARLRDEDDVLVAWCAADDEKEALIATQPEVFFTLPHYDGHPSVLVRLAAIDAEELREVLIDAWRARAPRRLLAAFDATHGAAGPE